MRSTWLSVLPTEEPRSTHISLFQEPNAQTLPLTFLLKCICFTLSQEGSLELWPGCFGGEGAEGALKSDLSGDPPYSYSDPHKVPSLLQDPDAFKEDGHVGAGHVERKEAPLHRGMEVYFTGIFWQELQTTRHQQKAMNSPLEWGPIASPACLIQNSHQTLGRSP